MLTGILTVLKIIGIALLAILAVVLVLLLLILFVPVRYRLDGTIPETDLEQGFDLEKVIGSARFSWLLHFVSGGIEYPENKEFTVKILGIKVLPGKEKPSKEDKEDKKDKKSKKKKDKESDSESDTNTIEEQKEALDSEEKDKEESEIEVESEIIAESGSTDQNEGTEKDSDNVQSDESEDEDKALIEIIWNIIEKIENILKTPQNVLSKIQYTISRVCGKIGMIKTTLENDIFKRAFELVKGKLIKLIKMILPDKSKVDIMLGLGDPADTAQAMAAFGALYPVLFKSVTFRPDFDRKVIYADAHFKGHITLFTVLYCVLVCYFNKDVKKVIKRFKKILNS